jgi:hypothetical protein
VHRLNLVYGGFLGRCARTRIKTNIIHSLMRKSKSLLVSQPSIEFLGSLCFLEYVTRNFSCRVCSVRVCRGGEKRLAGITAVAGFGYRPSRSNKYGYSRSIVQFNTHYVHPTRRVENQETVLNRTGRRSELPLGLNNKASQTRGTDLRIRVGEVIATVACAHVVNDCPC